MIKRKKSMLHAMRSSLCAIASRPGKHRSGKILASVVLCVAIAACSSESDESIPATTVAGAVPPSPTTSADTIGAALVELDDSQGGGVISFDDGQGGQPGKGDSPTVPGPPVPGGGSCIDCSSKKLSLEWTAAADTDIGYFVYYGTHPDEVNQVATSVTLDNPAQVNEMFSVTLTAGSDLGLEAGSAICFSVSALNTFGETDRSSPVCQSL